MKKYLIPENGNFYKANLHCHTTCSDGKWSPEKVKEEYMAMGYSVVAYTDHNLMLPHTDLSDDRFLALTGYEIDFTEPKDRGDLRKTCHLCFIAPTATGTKQVCYHRTKHVLERNEYLRALADFDSSLPDYEREYTPECINEATRQAREAGYFITYNHPTWSNEDYLDYMSYENLDAMEIVNYSCLHGGYEEYNPRVYDDMLRSYKQKLYCVAADDNHNKKSDSFGGFTVIKADSLDYSSVFSALKAGSFYASQAPLIHELWLDEEDVVHIKCSPAARILLRTGLRKADCVYAQDGEPLTEASFKIEANFRYFRLVVIDERGYAANTNAYFTSEWLG